MWKFEGKGDGIESRLPFKIFSTLATYKYMSFVVHINIAWGVKTKHCWVFTAILYRASTGPEQDFPCEVFHTGKNLFSLQGTPVLIAGTPVFITGISLWENFIGKTLFSLQGMGLQCWHHPAMFYLITSSKLSRQ